LATNRVPMTYAQSHARRVALGIGKELRTMTLRTQIGETIRQARKLKGWSQATTSHKAGMSESAVSRAEKGYSDVSAFALDCILQALGLEPARLPEKPRGFGCFTKRKMRAVARKAGRAAHAKGVAYKWTRETAAAAGRIGGLKCHANRRLAKAAAGQ